MCVTHALEISKLHVDICVTANELSLLWMSTNEEWLRKVLLDLHIEA